MLSETEDIGVALPVSQLHADRSLTPSQVLQIIHAHTGRHIESPRSTLDLDHVRAQLAAQGEAPEIVAEVLNSLLIEYYTAKYIDYVYTDGEGNPTDARGLDRNWAQVLRRHILDSKWVDFAGLSILDVGCSNGLELEDLFFDAASIAIVDISAQLVSAALARRPPRTTHGLVARAENLHEIPDATFDLYFSSRVFQSKDFGLEAAVAEAVRVVKPWGRICISIANGFVAAIDGGLVGASPILMPGLLRDGYGVALDQELPWRMVDELTANLERRGWKNSIQTVPGEIVVVADAP